MQKVGKIGWLAWVIVGMLLAGCDKLGETEFPTIDRLTAGIFLDPVERAILPVGVDLRPVYDKGIDLTKLSEGFRSKLYNDAAQYCTIAYGHLVKMAPCDGTEPAEFRRGVTEAQGEALLIDDMARAQITVMTSVKVELTDGQYAALCDFVYNVGSGNFRRSTLRKVVNAGKFDQVPTQLLRWIKAGGRELEGLVIRRQREIELFYDGLARARTMPQIGADLSLIDIQVGESER